MKEKLNMFDKNSTKGITLIALVVTIIVLLILAGISISMLSGDNGLLNRTTEARERTIHANVFEQLQLEELAHLTDKSTSRDTSTLIGYLQSKSIIGDEIGEETGKYQVNVTALLGSKQSLGNGDATSELKDVYMLEKQNVSSGGILNTKVATTHPIRIASTTKRQVTYKVVYYGNNTSSVAILGNLSDSITIIDQSGPDRDDGDYSALLYNYYKDMNYEQVEGSNTIDGTDATWLFSGNGGDFYPDYLEYKGSIYKVTYTDINTNTVKAVEKINADINFNEFGVYTLDGNNILITPSTPNNLIHLDYEEPNTYENMYYLKSNGKDVDLERPFTGSVYKAGGLYYNSSGENIPVIQVSGPNSYGSGYYLKENGDIDFDRPFTEGYFSSDNESYYDTSGRRVLVVVPPA